MKKNHPYFASIISIILSFLLALIPFSDIVCASESYGQEGSWQYDGVSWWYLYADGTYPADTWALIDGDLYYFDYNGDLRTGWIYYDYSWYFSDEEGIMTTGWAEIDNDMYYFGQDGTMTVGWAMIDGEWLFFDDEGILTSEYEDISGNDDQEDSTDERSGPDDTYDDYPDSGLVYGGTYFISSALGGCLDVEYSSVYDGANVLLYDICDDASQKWVVQYDGSGYFHLRNLHSWKCLDTNGYNTQQSTYDSWSYTQLWTLNFDDNGYCTIVNAAGFALDISAGWGGNGVNVDAYPADGSSTQKWYLTQTYSGTELDYTQDGYQNLGIRSYYVEEGNIYNTSGYYDIETNIDLPSGGYALYSGDNYSIGLKVAYVNSFLAQAGYLDWDYYNYNRYDANTAWAVARFQEDNGLEVDGVTGLETWLAMGYSEYDFYNLGSYVTPLKVYAYGSSREAYIQAMLDTAAEYAWAGTGFMDGASGPPGTYVDCSGLIFQCLYAAGINPDFNIIDHAQVIYEYTSYYLGHDWKLGLPTDYAEPGDLLFYGSSAINHIAIYAGNGMIYDSWPGIGVTYRNMYAPGSVVKIIRIF